MIIRNIVDDIMLIDTAIESFDMLQIDNRRFMYSPENQELVLGKQYPSSSELTSSHAVEHSISGASAPFDSFIRGWVGTGGNYPFGVIHFAPHIPCENIDMFSRAFDTLAMFFNNGASESTVIRGFGKQWEQEIQNIMCTERILKA